jgi:hypothetical protein
MRSRRWLKGLPLLAACSAISLPAWAVDLGQIDTFEDGTTQGWIVGFPHPVPPQNFASGGPAGVDDNYLLLTATGNPGPGGKLSAFNLEQWAGDYLAAGITTITMDVNNFGTEDLALRLLFADPSPAGPPSNIAASTEALLVPSGSGWVSLSFPVDPASLTAGLGTVEDALSGATELRLYHSPALTFPGPNVAVRLGLDNIAAPAAVPEPASCLAFGVGMLAFAACGQLRRRRS